MNNTLAIRPDLSQLPETCIQADAVRAEAKELRSRRKDFAFVTNTYRQGCGRIRFRAQSGAIAPSREPQLPTGGDRKVMKTITDYETVCNFNNLYEAHKKARRSKRHKPDVIAFEMNLAHNLWEIKDALECGDYTVSGYKRFMIYDPKEREIQALCYADRIVQHSLCDNVLMPFFENRLIYDNCACRVGKGTHFGMRRLTGFMREHYTRHGSQGWILKADVSKFFQSIDHGVLLERLRRIIPDPDVMKLIEHIVRSFNAETGMGLPMGNQTSQLFALYYLDPLDRLIKEKLQIKHYTRYMDDMVLLHPNKEYLRECLKQMRALAAEELKFTLNNKTQIFPMVHGVDYLGWVRHEVA